MLTFHVYEVEETKKKDMFVSYGNGEIEKRQIEKECGRIQIIASYSWNEVKEILSKQS